MSGQESSSFGSGRHGKDGYDGTPGFRGGGLEGWGEAVHAPQRCYVGTILTPAHIKRQCLRTMPNELSAAAADRNASDQQGQGRLLSTTMNHASPLQEGLYSGESFALIVPCASQVLSPSIILATAPHPAATACPAYIRSILRVGSSCPRGRSARNPGQVGVSRRRSVAFGPEKPRIVLHCLDMPTAHYVEPCASRQLARVAHDPIVDSFVRRTILEQKSRVGCVRRYLVQVSESMRKAL